MIMKSGADAFHGSVQGSWEDDSFQGDNISPELEAQGITFTNPINYYHDWNADFGGYAVRSKLWFYGGASSQKTHIPDWFRGGPQSPRVLDVPRCATW